MSTHNIHVFVVNLEKYQYFLVEKKCLIWSNERQVDLSLGLAHKSGTSAQDKHFEQDSWRLLKNVTARVLKKFSADLA